MNQYLFKNITVVNPDQLQCSTTLSNAWVVVRSGRIVYVGTDEIMAHRELGDQPYETYDGSRRILLPALANTHGHIAMTLLRNQADDLNLQDWLFQVIFPREARLNPEVVKQGTLLGLAEMIRSGTGAAADMYYFSDAAAEIALQTGFRLNICCPGTEADPSGNLLPAPQILERGVKQYSRHPSGLLRVSLLVHSIYLYDAAIYPQLADLALAADCPVQVHIAETHGEVADCLEKYGCRPPGQLDKFGFFRTPTLAAHCVYLDDEDRAILSHYNVTAAHNPSSNLKLGSGIADVPAMLRAGMKVGLGTDGAASNNNLDLYREMRLASYLAKGLSGNAASLPAEAVLNMATVQGMAGLGFPDSGRIQAGSLADLQIIDYNRPGMTPLGDPAAALVYSLEGSWVESLMVAGKWLMYKHELQTIDEEKVLIEARQAARYLHDK